MNGSGGNFFSITAPTHQLESSCPVKHKAHTRTHAAHWSRYVNYNYILHSRQVIIGVASYGALGHVSPPPIDFHLIFQVTSDPHKLWHSTPCGCLSSKNCSLSFVPPRNKSWRRHCKLFLSSNKCQYTTAATLPFNWPVSLPPQIMLTGMWSGDHSLRLKNSIKTKLRSWC